jgi:hypothetical protein
VSDWIEWKGGTRPVGRHELVDVQFGNGEISERNPAEHWVWNINVEKALRHTDGGGVIVAYRLRTGSKARAYSHLAPGDRGDGRYENNEGDTLEGWVVGDDEHRGSGES